MEEDRWNPSVCAVAVGLGTPLFTLFSVKGVAGFSAPVGALPAPVLLLLLGLPIAALLAWRMPKDAPPTGCLGTLLLVVSFTAGILWTNVLADELVSALQFIGTALGISPTILGLTVLAWGNSLGDFIADTSLARAGNPRMGAASCFGSPLFNMLFGAGVSLWVTTLQKGPFCLARDKAVPTSLFFLLALMLITLIVPTSCLGFKLSRKYGIFLLVYYLIYLIAALLMQLVPDSWYDTFIWPWFKLGSPDC